MSSIVICDIVIGSYILTFCLQTDNKMTNEKHDNYLKIEAACQSLKIRPLKAQADDNKITPILTLTKF